MLMPSGYYLHGRWVYCLFINRRDMTSVWLLSKRGNNTKRYKVMLGALQTIGEVILKRYKVMWGALQRILDLLFLQLSDQIHHTCILFRKMEKFSLWSSYTALNLQLQTSVSLEMQCSKLSWIIQARGPKICEHCSVQVASSATLHNEESISGYSGL